MADSTIERSARFACNDVIQTSAAGTCASTTSVAKPPTLADLRELVDQLRAAMPPVEPLAAWMAEQGCAPADGWVLLVTPEQFTTAGPFPPRYLRASTLLPRPMFVNEHWLTARPVRS